MSEQQNETQASQELTDMTPPKDIRADLARLKNGHETPLPPNPPARRGRLRRRGLLLGGSALAVLALAGGGTALTLELKNLSKPTLTPGPLPPTPTPTLAVPAVRTFLSSQITLTIKAHSETVTNVLWHPTGRYLVSGSYDQTIKLWDIESTLQSPTSPARTQPLYTNTARGYYSFDELHWSTDGQKLVTVYLDDIEFAITPRVLHAFLNNDKGQLFTNPDVPTKNAFYLNALPGPRDEILAAVDGSLRRYLKIDLWHLSQPDKPFASLSYQDPAQFIGDTANITITGWSCDGSLLAALINTGSLVVWDTKKLTVRTVIQIDSKSGDKNVNVSRITLSWSPVNPHILAVFNIDTTAVVDVSQNKILYQLTTDDPDAFKVSTNPKRKWPPHVVAITWSPDGRYIAGSYASSNKVYLWDTQAEDAKTKNGVRLQQFILPHKGDPLAHRDAITDISWSNDGRFLATASYDKAVKVWTCTYNP
jgi:WD40 repeat protein